MSWRSWCIYKLGRRDYSAFEMIQLVIKRAKESGMEVDPQPVVDKLVQEDIINDERFVLQQISLHSETYARKGPKKLRKDLQTTGGISVDLLDKHIHIEDEKWFQMARLVADKTLNSKNIYDERPLKIPEKIYTNLRQKLYQKGFTGSQVDFAMEGLSATRIKEVPSDNHTIERWIEKRMNSGKGPYDIQQFLKQKGVEEKDFSPLLDFPDEVWAEMAEKERTKRFGETKPRTQKDKRKQTEFLQRRGFSFQHIRAAFESN